MSEHNKNITKILKSAGNEVTLDAKAFVDPRLSETSISDTKIATEFANATTARVNGELTASSASPERVKFVSVGEVFPGL
ncbi:MAG: hypothetical protein HQL35_10740 [Alphaproteobacteria bacterium]|nr:hypothetical protein [Alphaproteobacteria bacterium]